MADRFGPGADALYRRLVEVVPEAFVSAVSAAAVPEAASELLYVCRRRP